MSTIIKPDFTVKPIDTIQTAKSFLS